MLCHIVLLALGQIGSHPAVSTERKITSIEMSTRPGFVARPNFFTAVLRPGGHLKFYGSPANGHAGAWLADFPAEDFDRLSQAVDILGFEGLKGRYAKPITDQGAVIVTVRRGSRSKSVQN